MSAIQKFKMIDTEEFRKTYLRQKHALKRITDTDARLRELVESYKKCLLAGDESKVEVLAELTACQELFPSLEDKRFLLKFALDECHEKIIDRLESVEPVNNKEGFNVHSIPVKDGKSALHYLADKYEAAKSFDVKRDCYNLMVFLLKVDHQIVNSAVNKIGPFRRLRIFYDEHGYNYLHGCCLVGQGETLQRLLCRNQVDGNLMCAYPRSPLHVAAQYRQAVCVEVLLRCRVDPNYLDREGSTALHALSRPGLLRCECRSTELSYCDCRRRVQRIVEMLVAKGASLEIRNKRDETPLRAAVSRLDVEVTKALLMHGASLQSLTLSERSPLFEARFTPLETRSYALTYDIIRMVKLLESRNFELDLCSKLRMVKCWRRVQGNEVDHLIPEDTGDVKRDRRILVEIKKKIKLYKELAFCKEAMRYLQQRCDSLEARLSRCEPPCKPIVDDELDIEPWKANVQPINKIIVWGSLSLARICEMNFEECALLSRRMVDPYVTMVGRTATLSCETAFVNVIVKRHVASMLMQPVLDLERLGSDLFMTAPYSLNMRHEQCLTLARIMSRELLLRLFEQTNVDAVEKFVWRIKEIEIENDPQADRQLATNRSFFTDENNIFECIRNHCRAVTSKRFRSYRLF